MSSPLRTFARAAARKAIATGKAIYNAFARRSAEVGDSKQAEFNEAGKALWADLTKFTQECAVKAREHFKMKHGKDPRRGDWDSVVHGEKGWVLVVAMVKEQSGFDMALSLTPLHFEQLHQMFLILFVDEAPHPSELEKSDAVLSVADATELGK